MKAAPELEGAVEDEVVAWAENRGWLVRKMQYIGRRSCPDRHFYRDGHLVMIEFKRPGVVEANPGQRREHARYAESGWTVHVTNDRDWACQLLGGPHYERD